MSDLETWQELLTFSGGFKRLERLIECRRRRDPDGRAVAGVGRTLVG